MNLVPTTPGAMRLFRLLFGVYLAIHFFELVPFASELFSNSGMIGDPRDLPTYPYFPNVLFLAGSPSFATCFVAALGGLSLVFAFGASTNDRSDTRLSLGRLMAISVPVLLWYGWACLLTRNIFIRNPGMPYVGWLLLAMPFVSFDGERTQAAGGRRAPAVPPILYDGAWILLAVGYSLSGLHKLQSPSWQDGTALLRLLDNPLARPTWLSDLMRGLPSEITKGATWLALGMELFFVPLAWWSRSRPWIWCGMVGMHLGIMLVVNFVDLTVGMLVIHAFTFDQRWIPPTRAHGRRIVFFDGVCNVCNGFVDALMKEDQHQSLMYASMQGETAASLGISMGDADTATIVFMDGEVRSIHSDAVIRIAGSLGGVWRLLTLVRLVPRPIRDALYRVIARNRYRFFGQRSTCRIPTAAERAILLP